MTLIGGGPVSKNTLMPHEIPLELMPCGSSPAFSSYFDEEKHKPILLQVLSVLPPYDTSTLPSTLKVYLSLYHVSLRSYMS